MVKVAITFVLVVNLLYVHSQAGEVWHPVSLALSNTVIAHREAYYPSGNPAVLGGCANSQVGIATYCRFHIPELSTQALYGNLKTNQGGFGFFASYFGSKLYNQALFNLAYGHVLGKSLYGGIALRYNRYRVEALDETGRHLTGDVALLARLTERVALALTCKNLNPWKEHSNNFPQNICLAVASGEKELYYASFQLELTDFSQVSASIGLEYRIVKVLAIRAGVTSGALQNYSFGFGWRWNKLSLDLGFRQHPWLGLSTAVAVSYAI